MPGWVPGARAGRSVVVAFTLIAALVVAITIDAPRASAAGRVPAGAVLRVNVPEAVGGKTVIGQLTVDQAAAGGFVTAFGCADGLPVDVTGTIVRSDLNYDPALSPVASNRLIVEADDAGDVCLYTSQGAALIVDVNAASFDTGITSFPNRRTDTRDDPDRPIVPARGVIRINVPEAAGARTVIGQLTVDQVESPGYVTAFACNLGVPTDGGGAIGRSDLNYDGAVAPFASNRLIVQADSNGDICFFTLSAASIVVDVNGIADRGIASFPNERTDTRARPDRSVAGGTDLRVNVAAATGRKTVIGQLTADQAREPGFVTAYGCDDGIPIDASGGIARSDVNIDTSRNPFASNRLIVQADADGDVCFRTLRDAALIVDVNGVSDIGIQSFPNRRTDTRIDSAIDIELPGGGDVPVWEPFTPRPPLDGVAALTGLPADSGVTTSPILAVKIDNYVLARPQFALESADAVIEVNVEGVTRFIALFHTVLPPEVGPVRSARTGDLDLLAAMNRPVFAYSGANAGVAAWIDSASGSGVVSDFSASRNECYRREPTRPGPHNLLLDPTCAVNTALATANPPGPASALWPIDPAFDPASSPSAEPDTTFGVAMDGVAIEWAWDAASGTYLRWQDGVPHVTANGGQLAANTVVELAAVHVPSPVDARSPNPVTVGMGDAIVHRDGARIAVVWSRLTAADPFTFTDAATGAPVPLDAGVTFVQVVRAP
jgi:hypothetical protein